MKNVIYLALFLLLQSCKVPLGVTTGLIDYEKDDFKDKETVSLNQILLAKRTHSGNIWTSSTITKDLDSTANCTQTLDFYLQDGQSLDTTFFLRIDNAKYKYHFNKISYNQHLENTTTVDTEAETVITTVSSKIQVQTTFKIDSILQQKIIDCNTLDLRFYINETPWLISFHSKNQMDRKKQPTALTFFQEFLALKSKKDYTQHYIKHRGIYHDMHIYRNN